MIDNELVLADDSTCSGAGQSITSSAAGTKYGNAAVISNKGGGNEHSKMWFYFRIGEKFEGSSSPTVNVKLQGSKDGTNYSDILATGALSALPAGGTLTSSDVTYGDWTGVTSSTLKLKLNGVEKTYTVGTMASVDSAAAIAAVLNTACGSDVSVSSSSNKIVFTNNTVSEVGKPSTIEFVSYMQSTTDKSSLLGTMTAATGAYNFSKGVEYRQRIPLHDYKYLRAYFTVANTITAGKIFCALVDEVNTTVHNTMLVP